MKNPIRLVYCLILAAIFSVIGVRAEETRLTIVPAPGEVEAISEFQLYFDGDWGRGSQPSARITLVGPEGVNIPKVLNGSVGEYVSIDLEDSAVITIPGEYTLTIPAHKYVIDGRDNEEVSFVYTVVNDDPQYYTITPRAGNVEYLKNIVISFSTEWSMGSNADADLILTGPAGVELPQLSLEASDYSCVISFAGNIRLTTPGKYTLTIPAGKFAIMGEDTEEIVVDYTIIKEQSIPGFAAYDINPSEGSYGEIKDGFVLTIDTEELIDVNPGGIFLTGPNGDIDLDVQYKPSEPIITLLPVNAAGEPIALSTKGEYRLIFSFKSIRLGATGNEEPIVFVYNISGTTESIGSITAEMTEGTTYTLSGIRVNDVFSLPSGVYVVNGQKVLLR